MHETGYMSGWVASEVTAQYEKFSRFQTGFERRFLEADTTIIFANLVNGLTFRGG